MEPLQRVRALQDDRQSLVQDQRYEGLKVSGAALDHTAVEVGVSQSKRCYGLIELGPVGLLWIGPHRTRQSTSPISASPRWAAARERD